MDIDKSLQKILDEALSLKTFPGYAAAIVTTQRMQTFVGGRFTYDKNSLQIEPSTVYDIASLTKIIGPMSVAMKLIDSGDLQMNDPVWKYIPEFNSDEQKTKVTILHLLTYTLEYDIPYGAKFLIEKLTPEELRLRMLRLPLKVAPGSSYLYSNITTFILTQLIENVTGTNFYNVAKEKILVPLAMKTATFTPKKTSWFSIPPTEITDSRGIVQGFVHDELSHHLHSGNIRSGAAGLFASVLDVAHFLQMVISGNNNHATFFSDAIRNKWTTNQFPDLLPTQTPLGWGDTNNDLIKNYPHRFVVKGGFTGCFMIGDLKNNIGVVVLSNLIYPVRKKERPGFIKLKKEILELILNNNKRSTEQENNL